VELWGVEVGGWIQGLSFGVARADQLHGPVIHVIAGPFRHLDSGSPGYDLGWMRNDFEHPR
jgi:hypothetical protein